MSTTTRVSGRSTRRMRARRGISAAALAVAVGAGMFGALAVTGPAQAAPAEADIEVRADDSAQGKAGEKANVGFEVENLDDDDDVAVVVTIRAPANAQIESANPCKVVPNRTAATCQGTLKHGQKLKGTIRLVLRTGGDSEGSIVARLAAGQRVSDPKPGNNDAKFKVKVTGGSPTPSKSTRASQSASADPAATSTEEIAPPEAGNGAIPREEPKTTPVKDEGGLSFGFWIGVVAIVAALGLVGSLFYFRRKDRLEPDTGVFQLPNAGGDNPTSVIPPYSGGSTVYGSPAAPPPPAGPPGPPVPPPVPGPGNNDQTILMRRPDDL